MKRRSARRRNLPSRRPQTAYSYNTLDQADFDPWYNAAFREGRVGIIGRNLNAEARPHLRLFEGITRHRVSWIQVADEPTAMEAATNSVVIVAVEIK